MEKGSLPVAYSTVSEKPARKQRRFFALLALLACLNGLVVTRLYTSSSDTNVRIPIHAQASLNRCRALAVTPGPPSNFHERASSDRFVAGTRPSILRNARIWTGEHNGTEVIKGDIYLDKGMVQGVGRLSAAVEDMAARGEAEVLDVGGAWITPGIVDNHSHLGDDASPALNGAADTNSLKGIAQPWLRSLDGLNTHDDAYTLSISGGVTTANVLPGSANAIGGQAFTIKLRKTAERSPTAMLLEPPANINGSYRDTDPVAPLPWRQMKHACGENPSRVYSGTRMDTFWAFRKAYDTARQLKEKQDDFCTKALAGQWDDLGSQEFPDDLQWEALVDVLRGRVRVQTHCYEEVDLDDLVRLTNEFKFPIAAVHHAHEAYLVPDVLKKAYGHPPAVAMFAVHSRYKREAYRGSEFAPRILAENGIKVIMKSDHPVLDSRFLLYEAQQAHYYGLPDNLALSSVTTHPAEAMAMDHRIGYIKEGWDADVVVWDSNPLSLGATPSQVFIDGIPQLKSPFVISKPPSLQSPPKTPDFDKEKEVTIEYEGLPPLKPKKAQAEIVVFTNVGSVYVPDADKVQEVFNAQDLDQQGIVVVRNGSMECYGTESSCGLNAFDDTANLQRIDLRGGSISPGLLSYGSPLGLVEIAGEPSTSDGYVYDPLTGKVPSVIGGEEAVIRAVDGLQFAGRSALLAYRAGVTTGISAPLYRGFYGGLGTSFNLGAENKLEFGAVIQETTALHVSVRHFGAQPSVSTQIAVLRQLLLSGASATKISDAASSTERIGAFADVAKGKIPIVIEAHSADIIATLIALKAEVEAKTGSKIRMTISGATEAHLLAKELGEADVGVVLVGSRPYPSVWEQRRILPGLPLSKESGISLLIANNVTVGVGTLEAATARNARFEVGWAALQADGRISKAQALALASTNLEKLLGGKVETTTATGAMADLVATEGGDLLSFEGKVVAVMSSRRATVDLF